MRKKPGARPFRYPFTLLVALLIMAAVLLPGWLLDRAPINFYGLDKIVHFLMFFFFTMIFETEYRKNAKRRAHSRARPRMGAIMPILFGFSFFTEFSQLFADSRSFDLVDILFDALGILAALALSGAIRQFGKNRRQPMKKPHRM